MRQTVRYRVLTIPNKARLDISVSFDDQRSPEYHSNTMSGQSTSITLYPNVILAIMRPMDTDESGARVRAPWDPNDSLSMTKFTFPIFLEELKGIWRDMKIPDLYTYQGKRLELNETVADKARRVFMIGNTTLELSAVVIVNEMDDSRMEGIKIKFNNEQYSMTLTLNEVTSLLYSMCHMNLDQMTLQMYQYFLRDPNRPKNIPPNTISPTVDIAPKVE